MKSLEWDIGLYITRVASKENLSDDPSREKYDLLAKCQAQRVEPYLCPFFEAAQSWQALSLIERDLACQS